MLEIVVFVVLALILLLIAGFLFWRYFWFFRNPPRTVPQGENIVSPADGTVVYARRLSPDEPVCSFKKNKTISLNEIVRTDIPDTMVIIGIFMSPFNVHYNRNPISGTVESIRHYPARLKNRHMTSMHVRSLLKWFPMYESSPHLVENERTVMKLNGHYKNEPITCYIVQIAGGSICGIDSFICEDSTVERGKIFGMIRIGSQVDVIVTWKESMRLRVRPGDRVYAGTTVIIE